jgi:hypothetical protein
MTKRSNDINISVFDYGEPFVSASTPTSLNLLKDKSRYVKFNLTPQLMKELKTNVQNHTISEKFALLTVLKSYLVIGWMSIC